MKKLSTVTAIFMVCLISMSSVFALSLPVALSKPKVVKENWGGIYCMKHKNLFRSQPWHAFGLKWKVPNGKKLKYSSVILAQRKKGNKWVTVKKENVGSNYKAKTFTIVPNKGKITYYTMRLKIDGTATKSVKNVAWGTQRYGKKCPCK